MPNPASEGPIDLLHFVSLEHEQFLISMVNCRQELDAHSHLQGLFQAVLSKTEVREDDMVLIQLLVFVHYHFVYSHACLFRCHLSEAFSSARSAIDAALVGAFIIKDRALQIQYLRREAPFDNLARHFAMARLAALTELGLVYLDDGDGTEGGPKYHLTAQGKKLMLTGGI